jgi:hypothetical protein
VEGTLELGDVVGLDGLDLEGELLEDVVDEAGPDEPNSPAAPTT